MLPNIIITAAFTAILILGPAARGDASAVLFEKGVYQEETVGDIDGAIKIYKQIADEAAANRPVAAQALYRMGCCLLKKGEIEPAFDAFEKLETRYSDQKTLVSAAQKKMAAAREKGDKASSDAVNAAARASKGLMVAFRTVGKPVSAFPEKRDLSTPETAWAAYHRASAKMDAKAVVELSWVKIDPAELDRAWKKADKDDIEMYNQAQLGATLEEVITYGDDFASTISRLEFPDGKGSHPYSLRGFGRIDGQWKNIGEDRCQSLNAAKAMFMNKKDNYRKRFAEIAGPEATNAAQQPSAADKREAEKLAVQAWKLWNQQKFDEAEPLFQQAIQKDPTNANTWNGLGWSQFNQGKGLNAQHSFERCLALEPKHAAALNGLGWAAKAAGKNEEAINYWRKAIAACPTATAPLRGLAITLDELGKTDEAIQQYRQWLRVEPDNQEAKAGLQKALAKAKGDK